jgi:SHS2 domain-containing protein
MRKFKFIDITTSDVAFEAYGRSLNELFANAALAMFEVMINTEQIKPRVLRKTEVKGNDLQSLLFNWLNGLLIFYGAENLAFSKFKVKIDEKNLELKAECLGEKIDPEKHETRTEVKACTYHLLEIKKNKAFTARVILDI